MKVKKWTGKEKISLSQVIGILNSAIRADRKAIQTLIESRKPCNKKLANHPSIQVGYNKRSKKYRVGLLGMLNGLFGVDKNMFGGISAVFTTKLKKLIRFEITPTDRITKNKRK
jgi:hypothetical protein